MSLISRLLGPALLISSVASLAGLLAGGYFYYQLFQERNELAAEITDLEVKLQTAETLLQSLAANLAREQGKNAEFIEAIGDLGQTVGDLAKLKQLDPEWLQKYSKVYFLNENYVPGALTVVPTEYTARPGIPVQIHTRVWPYLERLLTAAREQNLSLLVVSGYRSFGTQTELKGKYRVTYGTQTANSFSAEQGYSEHQLGTTVDLATAETAATLNGFDQTPTYAWLLANAHRYGFILSYPPDNNYYQYEPWHWRFVGVELASDLKREGKYFYDLDQRQIDSYLIKIFD